MWCLGMRGLRASCRLICPSSMVEVEASREDVPYDTKDPVFLFW